MESITNFRREQKNLPPLDEYNFRMLRFARFHEKFELHKQFSHNLGKYPHKKLCFHVIFTNELFLFTVFSFFSQFTHGFAQKTKQTETNHTDGPQSAEVEIVST